MSSYDKGFYTVYEIQIQQSIISIKFVTTDHRIFLHLEKLTDSKAIRDDWSKASNEDCRTRESGR